MLYFLHFLYFVYLSLYFLYLSPFSLFPYFTLLCAIFYIFSIFAIFSVFSSFAITPLRGTVEGRQEARSSRRPRSAWETPEGTDRAKWGYGKKKKSAISAMCYLDTRLRSDPAMMSNRRTGRQTAPRPRLGRRLRPTIDTPTETPDR